MRLYKPHKGLVRRIKSKAVITSVVSGKSVNVTAMWDTGASVSLITDRIVKELQLKESGFASIKHIAGTDKFSSYSAEVALEGGLLLREHRLVGFPSSRDFDMIIGMDIISKGRFCVENRTGNTVFTFAC